MERIREFLKFYGLVQFVIVPGVIGVSLLLEYFFPWPVEQTYPCFLECLPTYVNN